MGNIAEEHLGIERRALLNILFIGDVVGEGGCSFLEKNLNAVKKHYSADAVIVNAENSAVGNGVTPHSANRVLDSGADALTLGNHGLKRREIYDFLDNEFNPIVRPANYHPAAPGRGYMILDKGSVRIGIINIMGIVGMENIRNPFDIIDEIIDEIKAEGCKTIIVDFHAEATAEKKAMGFYLDGRVTALIGTHTHIPTADEQILAGGTGYITDAGMTGPMDSCLGVKKELAIEKMKTLLPVRFENPDTDCSMQGVLITANSEGKCTAIERIEVR